MNVQILQSIIALNARQIDLHNLQYQSYRDILKHFRECGKSDDVAYAKYSKLKDKELAKMHTCERNQRELLAELRAEIGWEQLEKGNEFCYLNWED